MGIWRGWASLSWCITYQIFVILSISRSSIYGVTTFACMLHSTQLLFPLLTVKCWRMEAAGNSLAQSSSCKVGTLVRTTQLYIYISQDTHNVDTLFRLSAALSNTTHVVWDVWGNNGGLGTACCCLLPGSCPWFLFAMSWPRADCWHVGLVDILVDIPVSTVDIYS